MTDEYIGLINEIDMPTDTTLKWISEVIVDFPIAPNTAKHLLDRDDNSGFIVGSSLYSRSLFFDIERFTLDLYVKIYSENIGNDMFNIMSESEEFLTSVMNSRRFSSLDFDHTKPLWKFRQPLDLVKQVFSQITGENQAMFYLQTPFHFDTYEVSQGFLGLIQRDRSISDLLTSFEARQLVKEKLWDKTQKSIFTRYMNKTYPGTGEENFID